MNKKVLLCLVASVLLSGCVSQTYKDRTAENKSIYKEINEKTSNKQVYDKAISIKLPPYVEAAFDDVSEPDWLSERVNYSVKGAKVSEVLQQILNGRGGDKPIEIIYGENVDPRKIVSLHLADGTIKEALNLLTTDSDYGYVYSRDKVEVEQYISKTFNIKVPPGVYTAQMGSQGSKGEGEGARVEGQYINVKFESEDLIAKVEANILSILTNKETQNNGTTVTKVDGSVSAISGLSSIRVKASPSRMIKIQNYIDTIQAQLSKQVVLDYQILEFRSNAGEERGVDLNLVRDIGEGTLKFVTQGTSLYSSSTSSGYGFSFTGVNGWDGTTAFIKALEKQGSVSLATPVTQLALNNIPVRVTQNKNIPYIYSIKSIVDEGVISSDIERREETVGVDLASVANVQSDYVWLRVAGSLKSIIDDTTEEVADTKLRFLSTRKSDINFTGKMKYGRTYIISRVSQTQITSGLTKNFGTHLIGSNSADKENVETLILLTPRRFEQ
ncbi:hypothetical protein OAA_13930 [Vibrio cyclitrophicus 1F175]|uniref:hypothetical protein n=1 Tax=Vibrio cyclitrophicus TaxID=47951 RepID=UPI0002E69637|nr:hypothetical protein [Vibrio cyclitrophicus]OEF63580.1 hypothetical protein OAA_13930 [Vibrio cyclitrophicus 1F175]